MKLTILGTGNAVVTKCYNTCFLLENHEEYFLVDAGGGNQILQRLAQAQVRWQEIHHIFITHKHIDHILGAVWLLRLYCQGLSRKTYEGEVFFYGHDEVIGILRELTHMLLGEKLAAYLDRQVHLVCVEDGTKKQIAGCQVTFFDIHSTKAKQFGFSLLTEENKKLTCCGDEPYNPVNEEYVKGSDWLLHEAFCLASQAEVFKPYEKHHSTVKDAAALAESLQIPNLLLYHTEDKNIEKRKQLYLEEGRAVYSGNLYVPDDMESFEIQ